MTKAATLTLQLQVEDGMLVPAAPAAVARLSSDVGNALLERVAVLPRSAPVHVRVHLRPPNIPRDQVAVVFRQHYALRREQAEYRLRRGTRAGRISLIIGSLVLLVALGIAQLLSRVTSSALGVFLGEGLTIVGWVALWRPVDLLLFERWSLRREIALCRRLEHMEIAVEAPAKEGTC